MVILFPLHSVHLSPPPINPFGAINLLPNPIYQNAIKTLQQETITQEERVKLITDTESLHTFATIINRTRRRDIGEFTVRKPETLNEYEKALNHIIRFINSESDDIKENDVRIFFEKYLNNYYAYNISQNPALKGGSLHEFVVSLEKEQLISTQVKDDLLLKLKFLNDSSHSFASYTIEEQRSFVKEVYFSLHEL